MFIISAETVGMALYSVSFLHISKERWWELQSSLDYCTIIKKKKQQTTVLCFYTNSMRYSSALKHETDIFVVYFWKKIRIMLTQNQMSPFLFWLQLKSQGTRLQSMGWLIVLILAVFIPPTRQILRFYLSEICTLVANRSENRNCSLDLHLEEWFETEPGKNMFKDHSKLIAYKPKSSAVPSM